MADDGTLFVVDSGNNVVRRITPDGTIDTVAGTGQRGSTGDGGPAVDARLNWPFDLAIDDQGRVLVSEEAGSVVRRFTPDGPIETIAGTGNSGYDGDSGPATEAKLSGTVGEISLADDGTVYIADVGNAVVRAVAPDGTIRTVAGTGTEGYSGNGGTATEAEFVAPKGVAAAPGGGFYVLDAGTNSLRYVDEGGTITWVAGITEAIWGPQAAAESDVQFVNPDYRAIAGDGGPATKAALRSPSDVALAADGTSYIADGEGAVIRSVGPDGTIDTFAGTGERGYAGDGGPATEATFTEPVGVAVDDDGGSVYVADSDANVVRRIRPDSTIETYAGNGSRGSSGDGGPASAASLESPTDVAVDEDGNLFIATSSRIRRVGTDGTIRTVASRETVTATSVEFNPAGLAVDSNGNLFTCYSNQVFRVDPGGNLEVVAGTGERGTAERRTEVKGRTATEVNLDFPVDVAVGPEGLVFIAEQRGVYVVDNQGIIGPLTAAKTLPRSQAVPFPAGIDVGPDGGVYVADSRFGVVYRLLGEAGQEGLGKIQIPAADGSQVYEFSFGGRHERTYDGLTGDVLWEFEYGDESRLTTVTDPLGTETTIERDADGSPVAIVAPDGRRTSLSTTGMGYLDTIAPPAGGDVQCSYDGEGRLTSVRDRNGDTTDYSYESNGRVSELTDARGGTHTLSRERTDAEERLVYTFPTGETRTLTLSRDGNEAVLGISPGDGEIRVGADGIRQSGFGMEIEAKTTQDERYDIQTLYPGTVTRSWGPHTSTVSSSRTSSGKWSPSGVEQLVQTDTVDDTERARTTYRAGEGVTVEADSRTVSATRSDDPDGGRTGRASIPGLAPVETVVDSEGRVTSVRQSAGGTTREITAAYDGSTDEPSAITMASGERYEVERDANGSPSELALPGGRTVSYSRTESGRISEIGLPGGSTHGFSWGAGNLLESYDPPVGGSVSYSYDGNGRVTDISLPTGDTLTHSYDDRGRLASLSTPAGEITYEYAAAGAVGEIAGPDGQRVSFEYTGPLPSRQQFGGVVSGTVSFEYTNDGRLQRLSVDGGETVTRSFGDGGHPTQVGALSLSRHSDHERVTETSVDAVTDSWSFDDLGDLDTRTTTAGGSTLYDASHETDDSGRLSRLTETVDGTTTTWEYTYDESGRLTAVTRDGSTVETFAYDERDNLTEMTDEAGTTSLGYDSADRLDAAGDRSYSYDEAGRLTTIDGPDGTTALTYDVRDTLTGVQLADGTDIEYVIDPMGRRVGKRVDGSLEVGWLYLDGVRPVAEVDAQGSVTTQFVYGREGTVPDYMVRDGTRYRLVTDHRESVRLVVETSSGEVHQRLEYDAFGRVISDTNPGFQPFGFAGGLYDPDTGLVHFGEREYDPRVGRWTTRDPTGFLGSPLNLYAYAENDPINVRDPHGTSPPVAVIIVVVAGGMFAGGTDYMIQIHTGDGQVNWWQTGISTGLGMATAGVDGVLYSMGSNTLKSVLARGAFSISINSYASGAEKILKNCINQTAVWYEGVWQSMTFEAALNTIGPGRWGNVAELVPSAKGVREFVKSDRAGQVLEAAGVFGQNTMKSLTKGVWSYATSNPGTTGDLSGTDTTAGTSNGGTSVDLSDAGSSFAPVRQTRASGRGNDTGQACYPPIFDH